MLIQNLKPIKDQLENIDAKIDQLLNSASPTGLTFTPLTLQPTYQTYASNGWNTAPINLQSLYDNDDATASNLFESNGAVLQYGEVILFPGVPIPNLSKIYFKVGIRNSSGLRGYWELAAFNVQLMSYVTVWAYLGAASNTSDLVINIQVLIPFNWDKIRWRQYDIGEWYPRARFYDLKVFEVS